MARSSRSAPVRRPAPAPARRAASTSAPAPAPPAPTPAPMQQSSGGGGGMLSGIGSTIVQGMAFGTGSAIAHQAVGAVVGSMTGGSSKSAEPTPVAPQQFNAPQTATGACANDKQLYFDCLSNTNGNQQACTFLYDNLQACQRNETTFH